MQTAASWTPTCSKTSTHTCHEDLSRHSPSAVHLADHAAGFSDQSPDPKPMPLQGAAQVARDLFRQEGVRGLYKGFGTVVIGILPARMVSSLYPDS